MSPPKAISAAVTSFCRSALIEGKLRGNLHCAGTATINFTGKIPGRLTADHVVVERKAEVQFFRRVRVKSIEIRGQMTGEVDRGNGGRHSSQRVARRRCHRESNHGGKRRHVLPASWSSAARLEARRSCCRERQLRRRRGAPTRSSAVEDGGVLPGIVPPLPAT